MSGFNIGGYTSEKDSITVSSQDHAINEQGLPGNGGVAAEKFNISIRLNQEFAFVTCPSPVGRRQKLFLLEAS